MGYKRASPTTIWGAATLLIASAAILWWLLGPVGETRRAEADAATYAAWSASSGAVELPAFEAFLAREGVAGLVPMDQLLRSDVRWRRCNGQPFAVPPRVQWRAIAPTLRLLRDKVVPAVGRVRVVSGWRSPAVNPCLGGARASKHLAFAALDMEPAQPLSRSDLIARLCPLHARRGPARAMGLGIYGGTRFHIDTSGFRRWGADYRAASSPCLAAVHKIG